VATVAYLSAGLLALLALFGFAHAFRTPKDRMIAAPARTVMDREPIKA
jgi:hypothetical protein